MRIGIFADTHDHVDHIRLAVEAFNRRECDLVVFAGDFVSPIAIPPLRRLNCRMLASFGDNEGNKPGIIGGMRIVGPVGEPPFGFETPDGVRILVTHVLEHLRGHIDDCDIVISAHTHKPSVRTDDAGRLFVNPGECSGWTYRNPSIAILETETREVSIVYLKDEPAAEEEKNELAETETSSID